MTIYPGKLVDWAGNRSGGVRRLFDNDSGRPSGRVIRTSLLDRLEAWAEALAKQEPGTPRIVLLVGGPGNGKTEAIEKTIEALDSALGQDGGLVDQLRGSYFPPDGQAVPRLVKSQVTRNSDGIFLDIAIVQDASTVAGAEAKTAAQLLLDELETLLSDGPSSTYLCCVNRGILDDALMEAMDSGRDLSRDLLSVVTEAISVSAHAPSCWPLAGYPQIAVWPMDAESLLLPASSAGEVPARAVLEIALDEENWPQLGACEAGDRCPFCSSRAILARDGEKQSLLKILRWFEVGTGKRWSFRDLFTLASYLLSGHRDTTGQAVLAPCEWAARKVALDANTRKSRRPRKDPSTAIFNLVASQYHHAIFHHWDHEPAIALRSAIKDLGLDDDHTAMGLHWFLKSRKSGYLPAMIGEALDSLSHLLDPAKTDPDCTVTIGKSQSLVLRDLDERFSRSVAEGRDEAKKLRVLSKLDLELLERLVKLEDKLNEPALRRKRPTSAAALHSFIGDFAGRLVRRAIGARTACVFNHAILDQFRSVLEDPHGHGLDEVAREVERLLNHDGTFEISLTTTFGQPLPPPARRATLLVQSRQVKPLLAVSDGRPKAPVTFLEVGDNQSSQAIALTYDLFRAMKELQRGMSPASLPRTVLALLDTTRARLAGPIARDQSVLERARIQIGNSEKVVGHRLSGWTFEEARK